jgi:hypothetical protein
MVKVTTWSVTCCPISEDCSAPSWKRAYIKSQHSEAHCRKLLWSHMTFSTKHEQTSKEDAHGFATLWPVDVQEDEQWTHTDTRFVDSTDIPKPDEEDQGGESAIAAMKIAMGEEDDGSVPVPRRSTGAVSPDIHAIIQKAVALAVKKTSEATAGTTLCVKGYGKGNLRFDQLQCLKGAVAATDRALASLAHATDFFKKGVACFELEQKTMRDVEENLEGALLIATGGEVNRSSSMFSGFDDHTGGRGGGGGASSSGGCGGGGSVSRGESIAPYRRPARTPSPDRRRQDRGGRGAIGTRGPSTAPRRHV